MNSIENFENMTINELVNYKEKMVDAYNQAQAKMNSQLCELEARIYELDCARIKNIPTEQWDAMHEAVNKLHQAYKEVCTLMPVTYYIHDPYSDIGEYVNPRIGFCVDDHAHLIIEIDDRETDAFKKFP